MKKRINLIWLVGLLFAALAVAAQDNKSPEAKANPMKKGDVIKALESNAISSRELAGRISQRGVDFELSEKIEQELNNAGASAEVVAAVRSNYIAAAKKKGLFGKMTDGMGKAAGKTKETAGKAKEIAGKVPLATVAPLLLPPPVAIAVIVAQQAKKQRDAKSKTAEIAKTADEPEIAAPEKKTAPKKNAAKTAEAEKTKSVGKTTPPASPAAAATLKPQMIGGFPKLNGTGWKILDISKKGDQPKGSRNVVPTFIFCQSGRWEIVRYGLAPGNAGAVGQIGTYKVSGKQLVTKNGTDGLTATYKMTWLAAENILELEEGNIIMRLQFAGETTC